MSNIEYGTPIEILLVEDNPGDVRLTSEIIKEGRVKNNLSIVNDGEEAVSFLKKTGKFQNAPRPDLIILDLNLPKKSGREVLAELKEDVSLRSIPVIILSTSQAENDIVNSYKLNANCYITKPMDLDDFIKVIKSIEEFWFTVVKLP